MTHLLDSNICIYLVKRKPPELLERFRRLAPGDIGVSSITVAELQYGVHKSQHRERNQRALEQFLLPLILAPFDERASAVYGEVRATLERVGMPIGPLDTLIGAHALQLGVILVTNNPREFRRIPGLEVRNWVAGD
ncbi:MAG: type II toxin-antitoxin system VapC family toxin [Armatimonadetes bacterium]|nr:type II toxin-antitoxin system VapC family toxin [Armatimonadota bacterium]